MSENKVLKSLLDECLAYRKYGEFVNPIYVEDMIKKAFEEGKSEGKRTMKPIKQTSCDVCFGTGESSYGVELGANHTCGKCNGKGYI